MRIRLLLIFSCAWCCSAQAGTTIEVPRLVVTAEAPPPPVKKGFGLVRVTFDHDGRVKSVIIVKSAGSKILDDNTVAFGKKNWVGPRDKTVDVPVIYTPR